MKVFVKLRNVKYPLKTEKKYIKMYIYIYNIIENTWETVFFLRFLMYIKHFGGKRKDEILHPVEIFSHKKY